MYKANILCKCFLVYFFVCNHVCNICNNVLCQKIANRFFDVEIVLLAYNCHLSSSHVHLC